MFTLPDYQAIQVNIQQDDEEMQPLTRKEMKREKCKICTILSVQSVVLTGLAAVVVWGYVKLIMGVF
jgi:cell division septal protein FtsQ